MAKKDFLYSGPMSGVTLNIGTDSAPELLDVQLVPGATIQLPDDHEYVRTLFALGHLASADTSQASGEAPLDATTDPGVTSAGTAGGKTRNK